LGEFNKTIHSNPAIREPSRRKWGNMSYSLIIEDPVDVAHKKHCETEGREKTSFS
jgi:hypothetical protein